MGFLGLFIGPVLMALLVSIWREWIREVELSEDPVETTPADLGGPKDVSDLVDAAPPRPRHVSLT